MGKKIYVAASFPLQKTRAAELAEFLRDNGHEVTSRWLTVEEAGPTQPGETYEVRTSKQRYALMDEADVLASDVVVEITGDTLTRGGRHVEKGIAIGRKIPIINLGPRECVFDWHPLVQLAENAEQLLQILETVPTRFTDDDDEEELPEPLALSPEHRERFEQLLAAVPPEIASVSISYSGSGDSGDYEEPQYVGDGGEELKTEHRSEEFAQLAQDIIDDSEQAGWYNNEGAYGTFTFNIREKKIEWDHSNYVEETEDIEYLFELPPAA
jgi:hypothetical protein